MSKFKANADNKFGVAEIMGLVFERVENIVKERVNAGCLSIYSISYTVFKRILTVGLESRDCVVKT